MAISDLLADVGNGVKTGARALGAVAQPIGQRTAQVLSGEAPQIDEESRQRQYQMEDQQLATKSQQLEQALAIGQKYGTLTPEQQQQYVDQISGLYSQPRHANVLMEKLRKAIHPQGAYAQGPQAPLANPVPAGGTAKQDEANAEKLAQARYDAMRANNPKLVALDNYTQQKYGTDFNSSTPDQQEESLQAYVRSSTKGSVGKSPPVPGNQLPLGAIGVDGQPIQATARDAQHSFVEYNGSWWPVAKPKPVFKTVKGHSVLVDPQSGSILRDLGPTGTAKVTTRQTLQPGDDGQMHLVNLTSVTTPEGAAIEVEPDANAQEPQSAPSAPSVSSGGGSKTPAKKVGSILPKTGAKPAIVTQGGPVVPGLSTLARSKNPLFKADAASYKKANDDAIQKKEAYTSAQKALASGSTASSDQELIYSWVRSNVQGAGRMTQAEFRQAATVGSLPLRAQTAWERVKSGKLPPEMEQMFISDIKRAADTAQQEADLLKQQLQPGSDSAPPAAGEAVENWVRDPKTGKLVKQ